MMRASRQLPSVLLCLAASRILAAPDAATCGNWIDKAVHDPALYSAAATSDGTYAYVAGGYLTSTGASVATFYRYNPATNTWSTLAPMPDAVMGAAAVYSALVKKIYVFGGLRRTGGFGGTVTNATRIYDIATNTWSAGVTMPQPRSFLAVGERFGEIFLAGGFSGAAVNTANAQVWEYDAVANNWITTKQPMPVAMGNAGFGLVNGHLYVVGGRNDIFTPGTNGVYDYDIAADSWTQRANFPVSIDQPGYAVVENQLAVFGGLNSGTPLATSYFYDPQSDSWSTGPPLNHARGMIASTAVGNAIFAYGGYNGSVLNSTEVTTCTACGWSNRAVFPNNIWANGTAVSSNIVCSFGGRSFPVNPSIEQPVDWVMKFDGASWTQGTSLTRAVYGPAVACSEDECYVMNGALDARSVTHKSWSYTPKLDTLFEDNNCPDGSAYAGAAYLNGKFYRIAGYTDRTGVVALSDEVLVYDPGSEWTTLAPYPKQAAGVAVFTSGGYIYGVGGETLESTPDTNKTYRYDPVSNTWDDGSIADLPATRSYAGGGFYQGGGIVAGGYVGRTDFAAKLSPSVLRWDPATNTWSSLRDMPQARARTNGAAVDTAFYMVGGVDPGGSGRSENQRLACGESCRTTIVGERFDTVTPPNLPQGWRADYVSPGAQWVTTSSGQSSSVPNHAFVDDEPHEMAATTDASLYLPSFHVSSAATRLTFRYRYGLAYHWAGGVLEVFARNINPVDYVDVTSLAVGARFDSGGYLANITAGPLSGRLAWTGAYPYLGFGTASILLGPNLAGQDVHLRFRMGADLSGGHRGPGWSIDDVRLTTPCPTLADLHPARITKFQHLRSFSNIVTFEGEDGQSYTLERKLSLSDPTWEPVPHSSNRGGSVESVGRIGDPEWADQPKAFYRVRLVVP